MVSKSTTGAAAAGANGRAAVPSSAGTAIDVRDRLLDALSKVRAAPREELEREIASAGGDLEIDSKEAEAAIGRLHHELGIALPGPKDLEPEQCNTVGALTTLIAQTLEGAAAGGAGRRPQGAAVNHTRPSRTSGAR
jgi:hypothetical protein